MAQYSKEEINTIEERIRKANPNQAEEIIAMLQASRANQLRQKSNAFNNSSSSSGNVIKKLFKSGGFRYPLEAITETTGESKMNTLMGAAAGVIGAGIEGGGEIISGMLGKDKAGVEAAKGKMSQQMKNAIGTDASVMDAASDFVSAKATSAALGALGANVSAAQLLARQTGQIFNPNMELLFNGPALRSFNFSFKMTPRSPEEAQECKNIIRSFKSNMAPKTKNTGSLGGSGVFLKTPNVFELRYMKGGREHPFLHKFKQCFLTNISVNYTGEGVYATYDDASPISMQLDLSFKELEPIYDVDYDDAGGVGF